MQTVPPFGTNEGCRGFKSVPQGSRQTNIYSLVQTVFGKTYHLATIHVRQTTGQ